MSNEETIDFLTEWPITQQQLDNKHSTIESITSNGTNLKKKSLPKHDSCEIMSKRMKTLNNDNISYSAQALLAKWWKINIFKKNDVEAKNSILKSNSAIVNISKLPASKEFMRVKVNEMKRQLKTAVNKKECVSLHCNIAWFYSRLGCYQESLYHINTAYLLNPHDKKIQWKKHKAEKQLSIICVQQSKLADLPQSVKQLKDYEPVARIHASDLTSVSFHTNFALTHTPLIITGLESDITKVPWTLDYIRSLAGSCTVTPKLLHKDSVEWAKLECSHPCTVAAYIDRLEKSDKICTDYLFDWSLPINCSKLADDITIPKYFKNDYLQRTEPGTLYRDSWPSLFIAPKGATSELHIDSFASNFWMALFDGSKRWTFYKKEDAALLYPIYYESMDPVFDVDLSTPDNGSHPLLQLATPYQCDLQPGEVLFVPSGCPHRVENLTKSLAISANFVDASNFEFVLNELQSNALIDPRADDLYQQLTHSLFDKTMNFD